MHHDNKMFNKNLEKEPGDFELRCTCQGRSDDIEDDLIDPFCLVIALGKISRSHLKLTIIVLACLVDVCELLAAITPQDVHPSQFGSPR